jgi:hypothetical protein
MSYIDAGYAIGLSVLFGYAASLWQRRRRLERLALYIETSRTAREARPDTATSSAASTATSTSPAENR